MAPLPKAIAVAGLALALSACRSEGPAPTVQTPVSPAPGAVAAPAVTSSEATPTVPPGPPVTDRPEGLP
ncbi:MAG: hypothetical protein ACYDA8_14520, partial [Deferrisomatales bacterium]